MAPPLNSNYIRLTSITAIDSTTSVSSTPTWRAHAIDTRIFPLPLHPPLRLHSPRGFHDLPHPRLAARPPWAYRVPRTWPSHTLHAITAPTSARSRDRTIHLQAGCQERPSGLRAAWPSALVASGPSQRAAGDPLPISALVPRCVPLPRGRPANLLVRRSRARTAPNPINARPLPHYAHPSPSSTCSAQRCPCNNPVGTQTFLPRLLHLWLVPGGLAVAPERPIASIFPHVISTNPQLWLQPLILQLWRLHVGDYLHIAFRARVFMARRLRPSGWTAERALKHAPVISSC